MNDQPKRNPYRPGGARVDSPKEKARANRPVGLIIAAGLEAWTALYTAWTAPGTLEEFREIFKGFGKELSLATKSALGMSWLWWLFAAAAIAQFVWVLAYATDDPTEAQKRRLKTSIWIFGAVFGAAIGWAAYGLYSEVFKLGAAV
jgi:hypothetical protein